LHTCIQQDSCQKSSHEGLQNSGIALVVYLVKDTGEARH